MNRPLKRSDFLENRPFPYRDNLGMSPFDYVSMLVEYGNGEQPDDPEL